ncbi:MAG: hypothetical protein GXC73_15400 [Chitinophagaceae bacterium]|nr:hypothetical protein [Chitinophagaceae bacterium]
MKQCLFFILLCIQLTANAQKKSTPWNFRTSLELNQLRTLGGSLSIHPSIGNHFTLGAGIDLIRVQGISKNVVPIYLDAGLKFPVKDFEPFLFLQGGIPAYLQPVTSPTPNTRAEFAGKSFLGAGAGFSIGKKTAKLKPFLAFKYRVYQFTETVIANNGDREVIRRPEKEQYSFSIGIVY